ncbi:MAG: ABC transporter ATP-binding protein [Candidatus Nezhaarchaeota archaeon]|nr:ABC transporter ATP-binding protein [Candidatus Nezhaarchaeota archaeon]
MNVYKYFSRGAAVVAALRGVVISIHRGDKACLIGESGSGKTTLAKILCRLIPPSSGEVLFEGRRVDRLSRAEMMEFRRRVQYIPQCPDLALDPTWCLYDSIAEPLRIHKMASSKREEFEKVRGACEKVGLSIHQLSRKPRSVSGGELQRAVIARAVVMRPEVIVADEPTSMLDPSTQAKVIKALLELQSSATVLFITHDVEVARAVSDKVFVMLDGSIVESGPTREVLEDPLHPYTKLLLMGAPPTEGRAESLCRLYGSCGASLEACRRSQPPELEVSKGRRVRCWSYA